MQANRMLEAKIEMLRANLEAARKDRQESPNAADASRALEAELAVSHNQAAELRSQNKKLQAQSNAAQKATQEAKHRVNRDPPSYFVPYSASEHLGSLP